jgi:ATP-dependent metalloprotease
VPAQEERGAGGMARIKTDAEPEPEQSDPVTFADVAGATEAKEELVELVEYLKSPSAFTRLGGKVPSGVLLVGPPGTGKTLLAKAVAGEARVPFFFASGSSFEEMYVGVGAKRVRELFAAARRSAPCIVFIDEIDAMGAKRSPRDASYVKLAFFELLQALDGFRSSESVIVIAATNSPESLDPALVRPGRFDRHVTVPNPDVRGRREILAVHAKNVPLAADANLEIIARGTPGFSGADLASLVNSAAVKAAVDRGEAVAMSHLEWAKDKILMGAERRSGAISESTRRLTAFHEGGHALAAIHTTGALPVHKATIVPRGSSLGMVAQLPDRDETSMSRQQMIARLVVCMGGRAAEELILGAEHVTSGAQSDFAQATRLAEAMVTQFGLSDKLGHMVYERDRESPETRALIELEMRSLLDAAYDQAKALLTEHSGELHNVARALLDRETLSGEEVRLAAEGNLPPLPMVTVEARPPSVAGAATVEGGAGLLDAAVDAVRPTPPTAP